MVLRHRCTAWLAVATLALTLSWLVLMVLSEAYYGPLHDLPLILAYYRRSPPIFVAIYLACGTLTLVTALWLAALHVELSRVRPVAAALGIVLVPVYAALNAVVYFSQVAVVAGLVRSAELPEPVLVQLLQMEPRSMMAFVNVLAYAVLGIPTAFFGYALFREARALRVAGLCLGLSGIGSWLSVLGLVAGIAALRAGVVIGGVLFLLALVAFVGGSRRELMGGAAPPS